MTGSVALPSTTCWLPSGFRSFPLFPWYHLLCVQGQWWASPRRRPWPVSSLGAQRPSSAGSRADLLRAHCRLWLETAGLRDKVRVRPVSMLWGSGGAWSGAAGPPRLRTAQCPGRLRSGPSAETRSPSSLRAGGGAADAAPGEARAVACNGKEWPSCHPGAPASSPPPGLRGSLHCLVLEGSGGPDQLKYWNFANV